MMNPNRLSSPNDLISHLQVNGPPEPTDFLYQHASVDADALLAKLARYLRGTGHPQHAMITNDVVSHQEQEEAAGDRTFRAEQFLAVATGSELLPLEEEWVIEVSVRISRQTLIQLGNRSISPMNFLLGMNIAGRRIPPSIGRCVTIHRSESCAE
jgi:hypothetical protein